VIIVEILVAEDIGLGCWLQHIKVNKKNNENKGISFFTVIASIDEGCFVRQEK
jgi:hypothetical protein